jgi:hypothetical protein
MLRKVLAGVSITGLAVSSLVALAVTPASAACTNAPGAALNLYANRNSTGAYYPATAADADLHQTPNSGNFNDKASRARNSYACTAWVLYDDVNFSDRRFCIKPMQNIDLHDSRWNFGDKISSIARIGSSCSGYPTFS